MSVIFVESRGNLKVAQSLQLLQPNIRYLGAAKVQISEVGQALQVSKPGVGDLRVHEVQHAEFVQPLQVFKPNVGESPPEVQHSEVFQAPEASGTSVRHLATICPYEHHAMEEILSQEVPHPGWF